MRLLRRAAEATVGSLLMAVLAPPIAAAVFLLQLLWATWPSELQGSGPGELLWMTFSFALGSYLLGALPAFLAGLALPDLRRMLSPVPASVATGALAVVVFFLLFRAFPVPPSEFMYFLQFHAPPAFVGAAVAAFLATRHLADVPA